MALLTQLQLQLKKERAENFLMEARVREEISREFSELFSEMQNDYKWVICLVLTILLQQIQVSLEDKVPLHVRE